MLGQRNTLNESTTMSLEGLFVITFSSFLFIFLFLMCFTWSSAICVISFVIFFFYQASGEQEGTGGSACDGLEDFTTEMN